VLSGWILTPQSPYSQAFYPVFDYTLGLHHITKPFCNPFNLFSSRVNIQARDKERAPRLEFGPINLKTNPVYLHFPVFSGLPRTDLC